MQLTLPGVPDLYQGTELWDLSLVDPDNRRPVDFGLRRRLLAEITVREAEQGAPPYAFLEEVRVRAEEGLPKLWTVRRALALRRRRPDAFGPAPPTDPSRRRAPGPATPWRSCGGSRP